MLPGILYCILKAKGKAQQQGHHGEKSAERQGAHQALSGYRQKIRARKMVAGNKAKSGCFPKLLMLFLPFMAVGSYLFLSS
jgi:hypothetical protein